jgi:hypothetical protein
MWPQSAAACEEWRVTYYTLRGVGLSGEAVGQGTVATYGSGGARAFRPAIPMGTVIVIWGLGEYVVLDGCPGCGWHHLDVWAPDDAAGAAIDGSYCVTVY